MGGSAPPDILKPVTDCDVVGYEQDVVAILLQVRRVTLPAKQDYKMVISRGRLTDYSLDIIHCSLSWSFGLGFGHRQSGSVAADSWCINLRCSGGLAGPPRFAYL